MYVSGDQRTFRNRLHTFARSSGDFTSYANEALSYASTIPSGTQFAITREANKQFHNRFGSIFTTNLFASSGPFLRIIGSPAIVESHGQESLIVVNGWTASSSSTATATYDWFTAPTTGANANVFRFDKTTISSSYQLSSGQYQNTLISGRFSMTNTDGLSGLWNVGVVDPEFAPPYFPPFLNNSYPVIDQTISISNAADGNPIPDVTIAWRADTGDGNRFLLLTDSYEFDVSSSESRFTTGVKIYAEVTARSQPYDILGYVYSGEAMAEIGSPPVTIAQGSISLVDGYVLVGETSTNLTDTTYFNGYKVDSATLSVRWLVGPNAGGDNTTVSFSSSYAPDRSQLGAYVRCDVTVSTPWGEATTPSPVYQISSAPIWSSDGFSITDHIFNLGTVAVVQALNVGITAFPALNSTIHYQWLVRRRTDAVWEGAGGGEITQNDLGSLTSPSTIPTVQLADGNTYDQAKLTLTASNDIGSTTLETNVCLIDNHYY